MDRVWSVSTQKGSALLLMLAIADHAADDGYCWPKTETLASKIRMSVRTVYRLIDSIEKDGELYVIRNNRNNRYVVTLGIEQDELVEILKGRKEADAIRDILSPDKVTRDTDVTSIGDTDVTSEVTQLCHPNHQEPSVNRHEKTEDADALFPDTPEPPPKEHNSILENKDPLAMAAACAKAMDGKKPSTVVGPEGRNLWEEEAVEAFCEAFRIYNPPPAKVAVFANALEKTAKPWSATPSEVATAIRAMRKSKDHAWRVFAAPRGDTWEEVLGVMISRVREGLYATGGKDGNGNGKTDGRLSSLSKAIAAALSGENPPGDR